MNHAELCHKWAHAKLEDSRKCGSMSFVGDTLYSYATPIARIYRNKRGAIVLRSERNYSATTSKHLSLGWRAVSNMRVISVPCYLVGEYGAGRYRGTGDARKDHAANLAYLAAEQARLLKEACRAVTARSALWRADEAGRLHRAYRDYLEFFGIRRKAPAPLSFAAAVERARRIENPDPASLDKRERASAARRAAKALREKKARELAAVHEMARRSDWRLFHAFGGLAVRYAPGGPCMLRVNGEEIETSQGARVPLAAAPMVWNLVQRTRAGGHAVTWEARGLGRRISIGDYPLDRIDADGTLHAGCHTIPYSELASMARALGLAS